MFYFTWPHLSYTEGVLHEILDVQIDKSDEVISVITYQQLASYGICQLTNKRHS